MVEGSGFLQWLSVYALAVDPTLDVLMLDEPDAHLHPTLQGFLVHKLHQLAHERRKQVLLATHSTTILGEATLKTIFRMEDRTYLGDEAGRVRLFEGLGSAYAPRLDALKKSKRLFLHDGPSDVAVLRAIAARLGLIWPERVVCWKYTKERAAREVLVSEFRREIPDLRALSLQDRDDYPFANTRADLTFDNLVAWNSGLGLRRWRRRNLENYLLHPAAIARAAGRSEDEVRHLLREHGLEVPASFGDSDCPQTLANTDGKEVFVKHPRSIGNVFGVTAELVAAAMTIDEVPADIRTCVLEIVHFAA
jgi:energy-coupling factor transporter ATP-binding protein EcfA2